MLRRLLPKLHKTKITKGIFDNRIPTVGTDGELPTYLLEKTPSESLVVVDYPFTADAELRDQYVNVVGGLRIGPLLEDLDACAGSVAFQHAEDNNPGTRPLNIVTASVDTVELKRPWLDINKDLRVFGRPVYVGHSSVEVLIHLQSEGKTVLNAFFTMVAMDNRTGRPVPINRLRTETEQEKKWFEDGKHRKAEKQQARVRQLSRSPPTQEEVAVIHDFFSSKNVLAADVVHMSEAVMQSVTLCIPQLRNRAGKVFGGHLMKIAFELAWSSVHVFCKSRPTFVAMERVNFIRPVNIGDIIVATAHVNYCDPAVQAVCADVVIEILNPISGERCQSNTFGFLFTCSDTPLRPIIPHTYSQAMHYLEGRRRVAALSCAIGTVKGYRCEDEAQEQPAESSPFEAEEMAPQK
eukprot:TRINITY_DN49426_c0_g1_i1.p1 TRINITY_DN49426_c0_g1~~TRINITY_DN49426_c0_g1_i1.p1  ORF type:complete len:408 (+),score=41.55 TRINITY_DN49426_c0_g1_i1:22-1245(+)